MPSKYADVVVIGGGHNGLVAAAYLAKAGRKVLLLERLDYFGGAATSIEAFPGIEARLSRYSYLVSLLPKQVIDDLGLEVELAPRRYSSYTPNPQGPGGLLIDRNDPAATKASFESIGSADFDNWNQFYSRTTVLAQKLFPSVLSPLKKRSGYHVIGGETGDWNIPVGGMGAVTASMRAAAERFGAELVSNAEVTALTEDGKVSYQINGELHDVQADFILANIARPELARLLGKQEPKAEGAQVKVNMLLKRLPKLKEDVDPVAAFGGTFHINENYSQLQTAFDQASRGEVPNPLPCEIYCHSLTDPTILSPELRAAGVQTLTVFALHTPHSLVNESNNDEMRDKFQEAVIESLNSVLAEDIRELLLLDGNGELCIETKTTKDLEDALRLPGGNIFHEPLSWPFAEDSESLETPAQRWGVATGFEKIYFCGSSAKRGGAVSGIAGHNAAMAVLES